MSTADFVQVANQSFAEFVKFATVADFGTVKPRCVTRVRVLSRNLKTVALAVKNVGVLNHLGN